MFLFTSKTYKNFKNISKIQKRLIIQKKIVTGLYKALVACKQKGNIRINKKQWKINKKKNFNVLIINKNNKIHAFT